MRGWANAFAGSGREVVAGSPGEIVLIDECNRAIGAASKEVAHREGLLHRAFSVFLVDPAGRILLQRRSLEKYHSAGLWSNSCCGHPVPGERTLAAARRRTFEELGLRVELSFGFFARYASAMSGDMRENEFVYVYFGRVDGGVDPNPEEIDSVRYETLSNTDALIRERPEDFTYWTRHYFSSHRASLRQWSVAMNTECR
jgi:isopentenyl-diphosphate delta-isomerase